MTEKVSIIVPVFNVEKYIRSCIESLIKQTYSNIEIILVDDGSLDISGVICDEYEEKDRRIVVIHKNNEGVTRARKTGLENSTGNWICFVDGDDELTEDSIEILLHTAISYNVQMVIAPELRYKDGVFLRASKYGVAGCLTRSEYLFALSVGDIGGGIGGKFYSRRLFSQDVLGADSRIKNNEDYLMNLRLSRNLTKVFVDHMHGTYIANWRENSASRQKLPSENWFLLYDELIKEACHYEMAPYLFLLNSIDERLRTGEISIMDAQRYAIRIRQDGKFSGYFKYLHKYYINQCTFTKIIYKVLRKIEKYKKNRKFYR